MISWATPSTCLWLVMLGIGLLYAGRTITEDAYRAAARWEHDRPGEPVLLVGWVFKAAGVGSMLLSIVAYFAGAA